VGCAPIVAHAGYMKFENPREDSWNCARQCYRKTLRKSQVRA